MKASLLPLLLLTAAAVPAEVPLDVELVPVPGVSGLDAPLGLKHAGDGSGRIFIVEQGGTVRVVNASGTLLAEPFINIEDRVDSGGERGLLDIAFHPQFSINGRFYLHYSNSDGCNRDSPDRPVPPCGNTVVAEFETGVNPNIAKPAPLRTILTVSQDFANHNGGQMRFGPDHGYLYIALGDGGSANDPCNRARTLNPANLVPPGTGDCSDSQAEMNESLALLGKMLRIDIDTPTAGIDNNNLCGAGSGNPAEYAAPGDNPFASDANRCGEVLLYGLRNPWRWSFDRVTEDIWIGDVGQGTWEEVNLLTAPISGNQDLGWNVCEGEYEANSDTQQCPLPESLLPILSYRNTGFSGDCSITGGYRYRGFIRNLRGRYIYGDFCSGRIWLADNGSGSWQSEEFVNGLSRLRSFGEDEVGNVYVVADDQLHRFIGEEIFIDDFEH